LPIPEYPDTRTTSGLRSLDTVEGGEQGADLGAPPVHFSGTRSRSGMSCSPIWNSPMRPWLSHSQGNAEDHSQRRRSLVALSRSASSFMTMAESTAGHTGTRSAAGTGRRATWQCTHSIGSLALRASGR